MYPIYIEINIVLLNTIFIWNFFIKMHNNFKPGENEPNFVEKGLTFTNFPTKIKTFGENFEESEEKQLYEKELVEVLKSKIDNIEDLVVFNHTLRSEWTSGNSRNSPVYHVHGDYEYEAAINRMKGN